MAAPARSSTARRRTADGITPVVSERVQKTFAARLLGISAVVLLAARLLTSVRAEREDR